MLPKTKFARLDFGDIGLKEKPLGEEGFLVGDGGGFIVLFVIG